MSRYGLGNITNITSYLQEGNTVTQGSYWPTMLLVIAAVSYLVLSRRTREPSAFAVAMFLTTLSSLLFRAAELVTDEVVVICVFLAGIGITYAYWSGG